MFCWCIKNCFNRTQLPCGIIQTIHLVKHRVSPLWHNRSFCKIYKQGMTQKANLCFAHSIPSHWHAVCEPDGTVLSRRPIYSLFPCVYFLTTVWNSLLSILRWLLWKLAQQTHMPKLALQPPAQVPSPHSLLLLRLIQPPKEDLEVLRGAEKLKKE